MELEVVFDYLEKTLLETYNGAVLVSSVFLDEF